MSNMGYGRLLSGVGGRLSIFTGAGSGVTRSSVAGIILTSFIF